MTMAMSAALKYMKGRVMMILPPMGTGVAEVQPKVMLLVVSSPTTLLQVKSMSRLSLSWPPPVIATVAPGLARAVSSVNPKLVVEKTLKMPATCALPVVTAPWIRFMTCTPAARMLVMVVHVKVEPAAAVPGAKAQFACAGES